MRGPRPLFEPPACLVGREDRENASRELVGKSAPVAETTITPASRSAR